MRQLFGEHAFKDLLIFCCFLILPLPTKQEICCTSDRKEYELNNPANSFDNAQKCEQVTSTYRYLKDKDDKGKNPGQLTFYPCKACVLNIKPWSDEDDRHENGEKKPDGKVDRFSQSCGAKENIDGFEDEYGDVNKCKYHPSPNIKDAVVKCACVGDKCNKMKGNLVIPNEQWDTKMTDTVVCKEGEYSSLTYKPFADANNRLPPQQVCLPETKLKGHWVVGSCVAEYLLTDNKIAGKHENDVLVAYCLSDGNRGIDEWSAKFPNRVWNYPRKKVVKPTETVKPPKPTKESNGNGNDNGNGATDLFVNFLSIMLVPVTTVLIAF